MNTLGLLAAFFSLVSLIMFPCTLTLNEYLTPEAGKDSRVQLILHCLERDHASADVIAHFKTPTLIKHKHDKVCHASNSMY